MTSTEAMSQKVVVGVDGSDGSRLALRWATDQTERFGPVVPAIMFRTGPLVDGVGTLAGPDGSGQPYRNQARDRMKVIVESVDPTLMAAAQVVQHRAGPGLVELAARGASLLVVGSRGRSPLTETLLGSVASYCARHATAPVAIIPPGTRPSGRWSRIVVGMDHSDDADVACRWAIDHAGADETVVVLSVVPFSANSAEATDPDMNTTQRRLEAYVAKVGAKRGDRPNLEVMVETGDPRLTLREAAENAGLLVVGTRGHRRVPYLRMGSVSSALAHHPTVPTVVVPHR